MRKSFSKHQHNNLPKHAALDFCGVEDITVNVAAAFTVNSSQVFRDDIDIRPSHFNCTTRSLFDITSTRERSSSRFLPPEKSAPSA